MVTRNYNGVIWQVVNPSRYRMVGYPELIEAFFDGKHWRITTDPYMDFSSITEISELIEDAVEWTREQYCS